MGWRQHMFDLPAGLVGRRVVAFYRAETAAADAVLDRPRRSTCRPRADPADDAALGVVHLIEETARHVGHMDITRELLERSGGSLTAVGCHRSHNVEADRRSRRSRHRRSSRPCAPGPQARPGRGARHSREITRKVVKAEVTYHRLVSGGGGRRRDRWR